MIESEFSSIRIHFVKVSQKIGQEKYLLLTVCWKLIFGVIKLNI